MQKHKHRSNSGKSTAFSSHPTGWRILGFGKHPEIAAAVQEKLHSLGFQATNFVLTNDEAGDARLVAELKRAEYDGVAIGGYINGQDAVNFPATEETTVWFNRILNIIHANAPNSKIILVRGPEDVVSAIERVLGKKPSRPDDLSEIDAPPQRSRCKALGTLKSWSK